MLDLDNETAAGGHQRRSFGQFGDVLGLPARMLPEACTGGLEFGIRDVGDLVPGQPGRAIASEVVVQDQLTIGGAPHVDLHGVGALLEAVADRGECVLGRSVRIVVGMAGAAVGYEQNRPGLPQRLGAVGGGECGFGLVHSKP